MKTPTRALVLAAGYGTRLLPLTNSTPKALLPICNIPLLFRSLNMLESWGVKHALVNTHYHAHSIIKSILNRHHLKISVDISYEPSILGTGGALKKAAWFFDSTPFWIVNSDVVAHLPHRTMINAFNKHSPLTLLWLHPSQGPRTVSMHRNIITDFSAPHPGTPGTYTFTGIHLVSPDILNHLPSTAFSSIIDAYRAASAAGRNIRGIVLPRSSWADVGSPASYLNVHQQLLSPTPQPVIPPSPSNPHISGFASIGDNVQFGPRVTITNSVIHHNCKIAANSSIHNAIIAPNTPASGQVTGILVPACDSGIPNLCTALKQIGWNPALTSASPLAPRGSDRSFTRLRQGRRKAIAILYGHLRPENDLYAPNTRALLRVGIRVPELLLHMPKNRLTIVEDVGDHSLLTRALNATSDHSLLSLYRRALNAIILFHSKVRAPRSTRQPSFPPPFSLSLYQWEHDLFINHYLTDQLKLPSSQITAIRRELNVLAHNLLAEKSVIVHRDFQSTNIIFKQGHPVIIDFQSMRQGPALYDIASLLCDPYVSLSEPIQDQLLHWYLDQTNRTKQTSTLFWMMSVQRLVQAIGAYARLSSYPATAHFQNHIIPATNMIDRALNNIDNMKHIGQLTSHVLLQA